MKSKILLLLTSICLMQVAKIYCQVEPKDIIDRVNRSPYIFEGEVILVTPYWNQAHDFIYTSVTIDIKKIFRTNDDLNCGTVEMILLGGRVGDEELDISHNLVLSKGERGIFLAQPTKSEESLVDFYQETNLIVLQPTDGEQGFVKYYIDNVNPDVVDYWQFRLDSVAQVYDVMDLYNQIHYENCYQDQMTTDTTLTIALENPLITNNSGQLSYEFDLTLSDNMSGIYLRNGNIKIQYDPNIFGTNVSVNNKVTITPYSLLADTATYHPITSNDAPNNVVEITIPGFVSTQHPNVHYAELLPTPTNAVHVAIQIQTCDTTTLKLYDTGVSQLGFLYTMSPTSDAIRDHYHTVVFGDSVHFNGCTGIGITSLTPSIVHAGTGDTVTITGFGFGSTRGTGNVYLKNADNGGASYLHLDSMDFAVNGWSNTQIIFIVPSTVDSSNLNKRGACPGSGFIKVKNNNGDSTNSLGDYLTISYAIANANLADTQKLKVYLTPPTGLYLFRTDNSISSDPNKIACINAALKQWRCLTTVNWELGSDTLITVDTIPKENTVCEIKVGYSRDSSAIAYTQQWVRYFGGSCNKVTCKETDMIINQLYLPRLFADTNRLDTVPSTMFDFYTTILHELGHAHSLKHVNDPNAIMYYGQTSAGILPANRKIFLMNDPNAVDGGNFVTNYSRNIDTVSCTVHKLTVGASNCGTIGINEINKPNINLNIYPNPTDDKLFINFDVEKHSKVTLRILDLQGREVYSNSFSRSSGTYTDEVQMQTLDNGYYLLYLSIGQYSYASKIIKQ